MARKKDFALYKGDEIITIGTRQELADYLGVLPSTITFYKTPSQRKRYGERGYFVVEIEDDEEE